MRQAALTRVSTLHKGIDRLRRLDAAAAAVVVVVVVVVVGS
jgi:hypothetical protein